MARIVPMSQLACHTYPGIHHGEICYYVCPVFEVP